MSKPKYYGSKNLRGDDEIMVAAFDCETDGLGGALKSFQYGAMGQIYFDDSPDCVDNFIDFMIQYPEPFIWYGHFAQYDWRYMMDKLFERQFDLEIGMRTDNDIYEIRIILRDDDNKKYKVVMRDSYAIWPHPLEDLANKFCPELPKLDIDFSNVVFDNKNPDHIKYAKRDIEILLVGLPRFFQMIYDTFGVNPNATAASTALKAWQKTLPKNVIFNCRRYDAQELFIRQAYYGGLVFLTDTNIHEGAETFDLNSSYPASMEQYGVPYGRTIETTDFQSGKMGIYRCRVRAPEDLIVPIIPARDKKGNMRWYRGEFDTVCTNVELVFAANHGYEILDIYEGIAWEETVFPFNDIISMCKLIRKTFAGMPLEFVAKLIQNSLYGKFGSRRERRKIISALTSNEDDLLGAVPFDPEGKWYCKKELDEGMRALPEWAVFITAHSRLRLLQAVYTIGPENVLYGDTDSMTIKAGHSESMDVGPEYGQWKLEKTWKEFRAIAPKVYTGILSTPNKKGQLRVGAAKGLPRKNLTEKHWQELLENGETQAQALSLPSLRVSMAKGVKPAVELTRKSSTLENSANFVKLPDGRISLKIAA